MRPNAGSSLVASDTSLAAQRHYNDGNALQAEGRFDAAVVAYRKALIQDPHSADAHNGLAITLHRQGRLADAVESYRRALALTPNAADLHCNLGGALSALGKLDDAISCYSAAISIDAKHGWAHKGLANAHAQRGDLDAAVTSFQNALALDPNDVAARYNLGVTLQLQGKHDEAIARYREALVSNPAHVDAQYNLANALHARGSLADAATSYRATLSLRPEFAAAHNNLGLVLQSQGKLDEAIECYRNALAFQPGVAGIHNNLGNALDELGAIEAAAASYRCALELEETQEYKSNFARCVRKIESAPRDHRLRHLFTRAMLEQWTRPSDLARACIKLIRADPAIDEAIARASHSWPTRLTGDDLLGPAGLTAVSSDVLLRALLENAQVCEIALERFLTMVRATMLVAAANASADPSPDTNLLAFHCALARQCFVNEYVFACTNDEQAQVDLLRQKLTAALQTEEVIPVLWIAAVAAYAPLSELPSSAMLLERPWPESVASLLVQQVAEPREETQYRENIPRLTAIDDAVSRQVQQQYEENPYPRWIKVHGAAKRSSLNGYLLQQFPLAAFEPLPNDSEIEILIAGCGTGQEATEAALQISAKRVLAIDLSLTSLAYAKRKTLEAGVDNIEYAQGDILRLASIDRKFDMVAASGVLHHLADPTIGWRALLALLRPGGFMRVALYSERARRDVVTARQFIAERGYLPTASDIRRVRQDLAESADRFGGVTSLRDFYVMSECRDLLFHVQEHRFTLPGIKDLLAALGLRFIGFLLDPQTVRAYRTRFPHDPSLSDLDAWDAFEAQFPDTFMGMYCFWVQKPR